MNCPDDIDWSAFIGPPDQTVCCFDCGTEYRSHARLHVASRMGFAKDPCPECGNHRTSRISTDPETFTL